MQQEHSGPEYYGARLQQNQRLAEAASDPNIRAIHQRYVEMYRLLLRKASNAI